MNANNFAGDFPRLAGIMLYPIKSLDGIAVPAARLLVSGALEWDRRWKIADSATDETITAKRDARVYTLRAEYDLDACAIKIKRNGADAFETFSLSDAPAERQQLEEWLSGYFERGVRLVEDRIGGFPDDPRYPGPTLVSEATLEHVAAWFPGLTSGEMLRRMRTNLVVSSVPAFWEDSLYTSEKTGAGLAFGEQSSRPLLEVVNPCLRCVVPTHDSRSGESTAHFATEFMAKRLADLPDGVIARDKFDKPFRLAVNTVPTSALAADHIRVGDAISVRQIS